MIELLKLRILQEIDAIKGMIDDLRAGQHKDGTYLAPESVINLKEMHGVSIDTLGWVLEIIAVMEAEVEPEMVVLAEAVELAKWGKDGQS